MLGGVVLLIASSTGAAEMVAPTELLARISEATRAVNYQGVIVYQAPRRLETMRLTHGNVKGVEMERIQTLNGPSSEIIKKDGKVIFLLPQARQVSSDRPIARSLFPSLTAERISQLGTVYDFSLIDSARVAGRPCIGVAILPKDDYRYGYQIWADTEYQVPLKVNLLARDGSVLEQMMFTAVEFPEEIPASAFNLRELAADSGKAVSAQAAGLAAGLAPEQPTEQPTAPTAPVLTQVGHIDSQDVLSPRFRDLPPGFEVVARSLRPAPDRRGIVEHLVLSDGLTAVSVFTMLRPVPQQGALPSPPAVASGSGLGLRGPSQIGAVNAYGKVMGQMRITVVGEAPARTVQMIGDSVEAEPPADASPVGHAPTVSAGPH